MTFKNATDEVTLLSSHFIGLKNNVFDYVHAGILVKEYSSHLVIENNEFYQSCAIGKTWTQLKGSTCEGGAVYGSSYGGGTYHIRNNWVHDVFNGFLFTDDTAGKWMNSNVFIYNNRFERVVDDPAEPEGDSFNFHVYGNTMIDTHRMTSVTTSGLGPVFIYNNLQITTGNPTNEASRLNSAFKVDLSGGYTNGLWIFNNTIVGDKAVNFSAYDMLSKTVSTPWTVRNNIYVTAINAFNKTPAAGSFDYDMSRAPFGVTEPNGKVTDALLASDGRLLTNSPAIGKATAISIPSWFTSSALVSAGANLGAFQTIPAPVWVSPPDYPSQIPANVAGWPNSTVVVPVTPLPATATVMVLPTQTSIPPTIAPTFTVTPVPATATLTALPTSTATQISPTATLEPSSTSLPPTAEESATPMVTFEPPTATVVPPVSEVIYDDKDDAFVYSPGWEDVSNRNAYDGSFKLTTQNNSSATLTFTGQSFSVLYRGGTAFRKMDVYVDDALVGTIDERMSESSFQQRWDYANQLAPGTHILKLVFVTPNTSNRTKGSIDAVIVR
jgi:hypothetical protein